MAASRGSASFSSAANDSGGWAAIGELVGDQGEHRDQHRGREGEADQLTERDSRDDDRADHVACQSYGCREEGDPGEQGERADDFEGPDCVGERARVGQPVEGE